MNGHHPTWQLSLVMLMQCSNWSDMWMSTHRLWYEYLHSIGEWHCLLVGLFLYRMAKQLFILHLSMDTLRLSTYSLEHMQTSTCKIRYIYGWERNRKRCIPFSLPLPFSISFRHSIPCLLCLPYCFLLSLSILFSFFQLPFHSPSETVVITLQHA